MMLSGLLITAAARCAPPGNKPTPSELTNCAPYLQEELAMLDDLRVVVGLGAIGTRAAQEALEAIGFVFPGRIRFAHGAELEGAKSARRVTLVASYHPSRQNTNTGVLTRPMLDAIFARVRQLAK
jgi:uracil-DNA glycosylase family 4